MIQTFSQLSDPTSYNIWYAWLVIGAAFTVLTVLSLLIIFIKKELTVSQMNVLDVGELRLYALKKNIKGITGRESRELLNRKIVGHHLRTKKLVNSLSLLSTPMVRKLSIILGVTNISKDDKKSQIIIKIIQYIQDFNIKVNHRKLFHISTPKLTELKIKTVYALRKLTPLQIEELLVSLDIKPSKTSSDNIVSILKVRNRRKVKEVEKLKVYGKTNLVSSTKDVFNMNNIKKSDSTTKVALKIIEWHELHDKKGINLDKR